MVQERHLGHLVIIGGAEDRAEDKLVLRRFVELTGKPQPRVVVLTSASSQPEEMWRTYDLAFADLGVHHRVCVNITSRDEANRRECARLVHEADGIFMTGGDQRRLMSVIGGTEVDAAMHKALVERGVCVGGTSAGASAMSEHMLAEGVSDGRVTRHSVSLGAGLGFIQQAVIDQHFSERHRLGRLLSVVGENPNLLGIGIDEDTALVVHRGRGLEVVGEGAITFIDGRDMTCRLRDGQDHAPMELVNVKLHLLPAGAVYLDRGAEEDGPEVPPALRDIVSILAGGGLAP